MSGPISEPAATTAAPASAGVLRRYLQPLWLLTARDLRVRYATSALGYLWSILDPLVMSLIYWFVFTRVFHRGHVGEEPYIVFLLAGLLPWVWFNAAVNDFTRAFSRDARLVRSTAIQRTIWVNRIILSKGIEFLLSIPVLVLFAVFAGARVHLHLLFWFPAAIVLQGILLVGLGLLIAPLCVLWTDLERTTKLILRALFYASPVIYNVVDLPGGFGKVAAFNPLSGIFTMYRTPFFPGQWDGTAVLIGALMSVGFLALGWFVFRVLERQVLKEL